VRMTVGRSWNDGEIQSLRMAPVNLSKASASGHCHYFSFILIFLLDQNASTWQKGRGLLHQSLSRSCS